MSKNKNFPLLLLLLLFVNECKSNCLGLECDINFLNRPTNYVTKENDSIDLKCYIDKYPRSISITWQKGRTVLAVDGSIIRSSTNFSVKENKDDSKCPTRDPRCFSGDQKGSILTIKNVQDRDVGNYTCKLGSSDDKIMTHSVEIESITESMIDFKTESITESTTESTSESATKFTTESTTKSTTEFTTESTTDSTNKVCFNPFAKLCV